MISGGFVRVFFLINSRDTTRIYPYSGFFFKFEILENALGMLSWFYTADTLSCNSCIYFWEEERSGQHQCFSPLPCASLLWYSSSQGAKALVHPKGRSSVGFDVWGIAFQGSRITLKHVVWSEYCKMQHSLERYSLVSKIIVKSVRLGRSSGISDILAVSMPVYFLVVLCLKGRRILLSISLLLRNVPAYKSAILAVCWR